jgi:hypothetical protein
MLSLFIIVYKSKEKAVNNYVASLRKSSKGETKKHGIKTSGNGQAAAHEKQTAFPIPSALS